MFPVSDDYKTADADSRPVNTFSSTSSLFFGLCKNNYFEQLRGGNKINWVVHTNHITV